MLNTNNVLKNFFGFFSIICALAVMHSINQARATEYMYIVDMSIYYIQLGFLTTMSIMFGIGSVVSYYRDDLSNS
jgi:hypothetical protein